MVHMHFPETPTDLHQSKAPSSQLAGLQHYSHFLCFRELPGSNTMATYKTVSCRETPWHGLSAMDEELRPARYLSWQPRSWTFVT